MRLVKAIVLGAVLSLALATPAFAEPAPTSAWGGTYLMESADGSLVGYLMPAGWVMWVHDGVPLANFGVDNAVLAASVGFANPGVLIPSGSIRGIYVMSSDDGRWMAFLMPDGSIRWEHEGKPAALP